MTLALLVSLATGDGEWPALCAAIAATVAFGGALILALRPPRVELDRRQGFLLTSLAWTVLPIFGALPLLWSGNGLTFTDAVFESVSGLTTTGSTVVGGLDTIESSVLFWRSMLQWVGGVGIIAMGIAILPFLRVGGMQIFRMESSDQSEKVVPRAGRLATLLVGVYMALSVLCALAYWAGGMTFFEAMNHAMTTISTGGYSTSDGSIGHFEAPAIEWIGTLFMLAGALPFVLYIELIRDRRPRLLFDAQVWTLLGLLAASTLLLGTWLWLHSETAWFDALRQSAFNLTSVVTTTGYASVDYTAWGPFAAILFLVLTLVGGCSGSTAGGFKIYRIQILTSSIVRNLQRLSSPHGVFQVWYGARPVSIDVTASINAFVVMYATTIAVLALALSTVGLDYATAISGAATAVANVGPGIGPVIGPAGNFSTLPDIAKWLLCLGMILGRLEIATLAVLLLPDFWRR